MLFERRPITNTVMSLVELL